MVCCVLGLATVYPVTCKYNNYQPTSISVKEKFSTWNGDYLTRLTIENALSLSYGYIIMFSLTKPKAPLL